MISAWVACMIIKALYRLTHITILLFHRIVSQTHGAILLTFIIVKYTYSYITHNSVQES